MNSSSIPDVRRSTMTKVSWRLIPLIVVGYLVSYIDRSNVAFASLTMNKDLGFSPYLYGLGAGIFFVGYALFEVPSNIVLERVGARLWIARIMITWGIVSGLMAVVTGPASFLALRFLLGVAEAGFLPGIILYLTYWFPARYRARVIAAFYVAVPLANAVASLVSGAILGMDGVLGLKGWQWVFVGEALPAIALGIVVLSRMTDRPSVATWLRVEEQEWLQAELDAERNNIESAGHLRILGALTDRRVITLALISLLSQVPIYGITFFLPQLVKGLGSSNAMTGLFTAIPYAFGAIGPLFIGFSSDRLQERRWHMIGALSVAAVGLLFAGWWHGSYWALVAMSVATIGLWGSKPCFWPMPSRFLTGAAAAAGIALINSIGSLGGYFGPFIVGWIRDSTHSFEAGLYCMASCALFSALVAYFGRHATAGPSMLARDGSKFATGATS